MVERLDADLDVSRPPVSDATDVPAKLAGVVELLGRDVEVELELARERNDLDEVRRQLVGDVLLAQLLIYAGVQVRDPASEVVEERAATRMPLISI